MIAQRALRRRTRHRLRRRPGDLAAADARVATVAHEMRAPLTAMIGALGLIDRTTLPDGAGTLVELADRNARRMTRLVDDLLAVERGAADELPVRLRALDLRQVVARLVEDSATALAAHRLTILAPPARRPLVILGDADRLLQVVTNILANAIRAAPAGSRIEVILTTSGDHALIHIADRGPGIPAAIRPRLFLRGTRAGDGGHGLGLAIARRIVARHCGRIGFTDRAGGGTRFTVALPLA